MACRCGRVSERRLEQESLPLAATLTEVIQCTVCLLDLVRGDRVVVLTCMHMYHLECIAEWVGHKNVCPQCITEIQ